MSIEDRRKSGDAEASSGQGTTGMAEQQSKSDRSDWNDDQTMAEEQSEWLDGQDKDNGWNDDGDKGREGRPRGGDTDAEDQQPVMEIEMLTQTNNEPTNGDGAKAEDKNKNG